ncbi:Chemotaxis protein CheV [Anatilimnocola aggregata]|uniref:Chemotaxis protein CheV n=1 Tax=Anatilimnocola aggregata TaxID=2528021 RepID=A0A517YE28_9BACT|nr:chemotaxis protein CheW [Anatilimnocola aggregata]QDU28488.1 Chemotaxis protein CheV [Anatilimnocola aggregata]
MSQLMAATSADSLELITFRTGDMLFGLNIRQVREINCQLPLTPLPCDARHLCGVISLRGDVLTVLNLNALVGLPPSPRRSDGTFVIFEVDGERMALCVDAVDDIVSCERAQLLPVPESFPVRCASDFSGVLPTASELLYVLDPQMFAAERREE